MSRSNLVSKALFDIRAKKRQYFVEIQKSIWSLSRSQNNFVCFPLSRLKLPAHLSKNHSVVIPKEMMLRKNFPVLMPWVQDGGTANTSLFTSLLQSSRPKAPLRHQVCINQTCKVRDIDLAVKIGMRLTRMHSRMRFCGFWRNDPNRTHFLGPRAQRVEKSKHRRWSEHFPSYGLTNG